MIRLITLLLLAAAASAPFTLRADNTEPAPLPPASSRKDVTFKRDIQPIFEQSCVKCHGAKKAKAHLRLDTLENVVKGSEDGKVIHPGDSAKSLLVKSVAHTSDPDLWMPPEDNKFDIKPLSKEQVGLIRAWIDQGAK